jgi:hypothetical protein
MFMCPVIISETMVAIHETSCGYHASNCHIIFFLFIMPYRRENQHDAPRISELGDILTSLRILKYMVIGLKNDSFVKVCSCEM